MNGPTSFAASIATVVGMCLVVVPVAVAQEAGDETGAAKSESEEERTRVEAKEHYLAGRQFHDSKEYDRAIAEYMAAYELDGHPQHLFNVAQVYRLKGDREQAVAHYGKYLE